MIYNQLVAFPTRDTLDYMSEVLSGSSVDLQLEGFRLEIITSLDIPVANPDNVYGASPVSAKVWYDSYLERSSLILSLESSDLQRRCMQLNEQGVARAFYDYYNPHIVIRPDMPPLSRRTRTFIHQVANSFCGNERYLEFSNEVVTQVDLESPPNYDYQVSMAAERITRRNM